VELKREGSNGKKVVMDRVCAAPYANKGPKPPKRKKKKRKKICIVFLNHVIRFKPDLLDCHR